MLDQISDLQHLRDRGVLSAERMLGKRCKLLLLEFALVAIRCSACRGYGATMMMVRLRDTRCPRLPR